MGRPTDPKVAATAVGRFIGGADSQLAPGHKGAPQQSTAPPRLAYSVKQFCAAADISEAFYYELKRTGRGPREMILGARRLISVDEAKNWCAARTAVSNPEEAA
jgi:hypothetical protein